MKFNIKKSNVMIFSTSRKQPIQPLLFLSNQSIPFSTTYKYLGITLDHKLNFKSHIDIISNKLKRQSYLISRTISPKRNPSAATIRSLVASKLVSLLSYSLPFITLTEEQERHFDTLVITPLRHSLSLPPSTSRQAIILEFRLLPTHLLQQYLLLSFCQKLAKQPLSPFQALLDYYKNDPLFPKVPRMMKTLIKAEATLNTSNTHTIQSTTKHAFLQAHFLECKAENICKQLLRLYTDFIPKLPIYIKTDTKAICSMRARLRFDRSNLNFSAYIRGQVNNAACPFCRNITETREHTLLTCPFFYIPRLSLSHSLNININDININHILNATRTTCNPTGVFLKLVNKSRKI
jgi:hypothetical protein